MEKKVSEEEIKRVIREYIERMFKLFKTLRGVSTDRQIDCPQCGRYRGVACYRGGWMCLWGDCRFTFPKEFVPPTPQELEDFYKYRKNEERIRKTEARINEFLSG